MDTRSRGFYLTRNRVAYFFCMTLVGLFGWSWRFGDAVFFLGFGMFINSVVELWGRRKDVDIEPAEEINVKSPHWRALSTSLTHLRDEYIPKQISLAPSRERTVELFLSRLTLYFFLPLGIVFFSPLFALELCWSFVFGPFRQEERY